MNLYLIELFEPLSGYDTYTSAVVVAKTPRDAARIHPYGSGRMLTGKPDTGSFTTWTEEPSNVRATFLGKATEILKEGSVVCAAFKAG